jgi:excisionase family DNA binding protein
MEQLKTISEVAELFQISRSTAYRLKKQDSWPNHRFGTEIRFSDEDIEAIRAKYQQAAPEPRKAPKVGTRAQRRKQ